MREDAAWQCDMVSSMARTWRSTSSGESRGESLKGRLEKGAAGLQDAQTREAQAVRHFFSPLGYWLRLVSMWGVWITPKVKGPSAPSAYLECLTGRVLE